MFSPRSGWWFGQQLALIDNLCALPVRCAEAVGAGIATAQYDHALALGADALIVRNMLAGVQAVLLRQEIHREVHAVQIAAGDGQVSRDGAAAGQHNRVELSRQIFAGNVNTHIDSALEGNTLCRHLIDAPLHDGLFQLEIRDAEPQ